MPAEVRLATNMLTLMKTTAVTLLVAAALFAFACHRADMPSSEVTQTEEEIRPFVNVTQTALKGLKESWNIRPGVVIFDYDRDGDMDFYVSNAYEFGNWLYRNNGDGTFDNVADEAGAALRQTHGTGVVACDVNNDGYQDIYVGAQGSLTDRLDYRSHPEGDQNIDRLLLNRGDGTFGDITESAFGETANRRTAMSATCADVDGDGWLDIFVGNLAEDEFRGMSVPFQNGQHNVLYRNNGDLTFSDISESSGVQGPQVWMRERDGKPVTYRDGLTGDEYEGYDPNLRDDLDNRVGDPSGQTQAVTFFDFDSDGDPDLWVANDGDRLHVLRNDSTPGSVRFTDVAREMGVDQVGAWMGFAIGDYDGDADLDIFISNVGYHPRLLPPPETPMPYCAYHERFAWGTCLHYLLRNDGIREVPGVGSIGAFHNVAPAVAVTPSPLMPPDSLDAANIDESQVVPTGLSAYDFAFGTTFFDYDNDGDQDLYWLGSTVDRGEAPGGEVFPSAGRMMRNITAGVFEDITVRAQLVDVQRARYDKIDPQNPKKDVGVHRIHPMFHENGKGLAHGDLNGDGYTDLIGTNSKGSLYEDSRKVSFSDAPGPMFVWMNPGGNNRWITLRLKGRMAVDGTGSNADGIGARVYLTAGERTQVQEVRAGSSYLSMDSVDLEFGLERANSVDKIEVLWPSGRRQIVENVGANQVVEIAEPAQ
ncbi:MAG: CRTAC1 family protein [Chloroflexi bacterium]|nr:CRTAC1 family protein [Chloroflexota bacterium]